MTSSKKESEDQEHALSEDEVLRRMLNTPPKPHKEDKVKSEKERAKARSFKS